MVPEMQWGGGEEKRKAELYKKREEGVNDKKEYVYSDLAHTNVCQCFAVLTLVMKFQEIYT